MLSGMGCVVSPDEAFSNSGQGHVGSYKVTGAKPQREGCLQVHSPCALSPPTPAPPLEEAHRSMKASDLSSPLCQAHVESQFLSEQSMEGLEWVPGLDKLVANHWWQKDSKMSEVCLPVLAYP